MVIKTYFNLFFIYYWKVWLPSQNTSRKGGFVNLFIWIWMKNFHFTIFRCPRVYPFQKIWCLAWAIFFVFWLVWGTVPMLWIIREYFKGDGSKKRKSKKKTSAEYDETTRSEVNLLTAASTDPNLDDEGENSENSTILNAEDLTKEAASLGKTWWIIDLS